MIHTKINHHSAPIVQSLKLSALSVTLFLGACGVEDGTPFEESEMADEDLEQAEGLESEDESKIEALDIELFVAEREAEGNEPGLLETASFAADAGISMEEAAERLDWQNRSGWLLDIAPDQLGDAYGGVWIDVNDGNRVKIAIAPSAATRTLSADIGRPTAETLKLKATELIELIGISDGADLVEVRHPLSELHAANKWISEELAGLGSPNLSGGLRTDINAVQINILKGAALDEDEIATLDRAFERYGDLLTIGEFEGSASPDACSGDYCDKPLRGGIAFQNINCTGAFVAKSRINDKYYQFTAGHCANASLSAYATLFSDSSLHNIGALHNSIFGNGESDAAIIKIDNVPGWFGGSKNRVFVRANAGETVRNEMYRISSTSLSKIGDRVCMSGRTTGTDCGTVQALGVTVTYGSGVTVQNMGEASYCRAGGDSGGPVYANGKAFGIHSGGNGCTAWYTGIRGAEDALNVDVVTVD